MKTEQKFLIYSGSISVILILLMLAGVLYTFSVQERRFNDKINLLASDYNEKINALQKDLTDEVSILQNVISNVDEQDKQRNKDVLDLVANVQSQSQASIQAAKSDLEKELANIEVGTGDFSGVIGSSLQAVVSVLTNEAQGSGVIVSEDGYVVTNLHVIEGARVVRVVDYDNTIHNVELVGTSATHDIAVLRIMENKSFDYLDFGNSDDIKVGESVVALGNPYGLDFTATQGIVSARRTASDGNEYIQIDVPINPGNSGGPVIDTVGDIIGIANFKVQGAEGIGFAIPSNVVEDVYRDIT
jgi:serine protease Do